MTQLWYYGLLSAAVFTTLLISLRPLWRHRAVLLGTVGVAAVLQVVATGSLLIYSFIATTLLIMFLAAHVLFEFVRIARNRLPGDYLHHSVAQALAWTGLSQIAAGFWLVLLWRGWLEETSWLAVLALVQLAVAAGIAWSTHRQLRTTNIGDDPDSLPAISDGKLPTITVAVPVRNEDGQLESCLTSILASNYPKLEILAFDDDSHDRTPDIIRSFAHAGVRFLRSTKPQDAKAGWLAKNRAYAELAAAANGEYILFCGADIRLGVRSLRHLVALAAARNKSMVAVMPQNKLVGHVPVLQAMRYYWEMAPPRRLFNRPPVLSSCWLVKRSMLEKAGGFAAVRQSMSPEAHLARYAAGHDDAYSFVRSNSLLDIDSEKPVGEQQSTARLRRYPQLHRRPETVAAVSLGQALLLIGPFVLVVLAAIGLLDAYAGLAALLAAIIHCLAFGAIQHAAFPHVPVWRASLAFPVAILTDIAYLYRSMYYYECKPVMWKDRNISQLVMRHPH